MSFAPPPSIFFAMLADTQRRQQAQEGVKALIWQYYEDYTDATELDPKYLKALRYVVSSIGMDDAYLVDSLDEVIRETEKEITAVYSNPKFYNGSERCGKGDVVICTPGLDVDEDEDNENDTTDAQIDAGLLDDDSTPAMRERDPATSKTYVHSGSKTHKPVEYQGTAVVTGCGIRLQNYSTTIGLYPSCKRCARKC